MLSANNLPTLSSNAASGVSARRAPSLPASERGAAMLAAMCFALVLAIALSSYITMCYRSLQMSTRNANSGHGIELAETGMEEALWALHNNDWTGWSFTGKTATKTLSGFTFDGNTTGAISLTIANYDGTTGTRTLTVTGTTTLSDGTTQSRTLTSTSSQAPLFVNAIAATGNNTTWQAGGYNGRVRFRSAGTVDSYDSTTDLNAASVGYSAMVASKSDFTAAQTSTGTVQMTNVKIKGYIATLPGSAGVSYSTSATLYGPNSPANPKIDTTRETTSPYQPVFDVITPSATTLLTGSSQTIGTPGAATPSYYYYSGDYYLGGSDILTVDGPVVVVISGYLATQNTAKISVTANGSLTVFVGGALWLDGGGIVNTTKLPKNVAIFGQTGNSNTFEFSTTTPFYGVIYAPSAFLSFYNNVTLYGAIVGQAVTFNSGSSPTFHYDTSLRNVAGQSELDELLAERERINGVRKALRTSWPHSRTPEVEIPARIVTRSGVGEAL